MKTYHTENSFVYQINLLQNINKSNIDSDSLYYSKITNWGDVGNIKPLIDMLLIISVVFVIILIGGVLFNRKLTRIDESSDTSTGIV